VKSSNDKSNRAPYLMLVVKEQIEDEGKSVSAWIIRQVGIFNIL